MHRELSVGIVLIVLGTGVLHAGWNAITKSFRDRLMVLAWIGVALSASGAVVLGITGLPGRVAVLFAVLSAAVHVVYDLALVNAYRLGAFNQTYPIARGTSPLVVALGAALFVGERLSGLSLVGVIVLAAGLMSLAFSSGRVARSDLPAVLAAVGTGLVTAVYSLLDGIGVRHAAEPLSYVALVFVLEGPIFPLVALRRPRAEWTRNRIARRGLIAGCLSVVAYGTVVWAQTRAPLAEVAALRETGVISAAVMGALFFKEGFGCRRLGAAVAVALGIVLISL
ncbi:MAG: EamA family transporter [Actinomycetota bacterium]|nr:EamA family transporter [Actinomycetota bacterium]